MTHFVSDSKRVYGLSFSSAVNGNFNGKYSISEDAVLGLLHVATSFDLHDLKDMVKGTYLDDPSFVNERTVNRFKDIVLSFISEESVVTIRNDDNSISYRKIDHNTYSDVSEVINFDNVIESIEMYCSSSAFENIASFSVEDPDDSKLGLFKFHNAASGTFGVIDKVWAEMDDFSLNKSVLRLTLLNPVISKYCDVTNEWTNNEDSIVNPGGIIFDPTYNDPRDIYTTLVLYAIEAHNSPEQSGGNRGNEDWNTSTSNPASTGTTETRRSNSRPVSNGRNFSSYSSRKVTFIGNAVKGYFRNGNRLLSFRDGVMLMI
jgi:hypothetical protein